MREQVTAGNIALEYVPTDRQVADGLTKALCKDKFDRFRDLIGLEAPPWQCCSRGACAIAIHHSHAPFPWITMAMIQGSDFIGPHTSGDRPGDLPGPAEPQYQPCGLTIPCWTAAFALGLHSVCIQITHYHYHCYHLWVPNTSGLVPHNYCYHHWSNRPFFHGSALCRPCKISCSIRSISPLAFGAFPPLIFMHPHIYPQTSFCLEFGVHLMHDEKKKKKKISKYRFLTKCGIFVWCTRCGICTRAKFNIVIFSTRFFSYSMRLFTLATLHLLGG